MEFEHSQKKIVIVFGTRPEIIKVAPLIQLIKKSILRDNLIVINTSQHTDLLKGQLDFWEIQPDFKLSVSNSDGNLASLLGKTIIQLQECINSLSEVGYIITQGDTNTSLACAQIAFLNRIKLLHIEAGLRSFDFGNHFPEEFNRRVVSLAAFHHFSPTKTAYQNLIQEGIPESAITITGNTGIDALEYVKEISETVSEKKQVLITLHRREQLESNCRKLVKIVIQLAKSYPEMSFKWVIHPNNSPKNYIEVIPDNLIFVDPLSYKEFVNCYRFAKMVITDSGGVVEEATYFGTPVIAFRDVSERLEPMDEHYPMLVTTETMHILAFFEKQIKNNSQKPFLYGNGNASNQILKWLFENMGYNQFDSIIIGGGPAGTGILLKTLKDGKLERFNDHKVAVIEQTESLVVGNLTSYNINSDTLSNVFLECLEGETASILQLDSIQEEIKHIQSYSGKAIPLKKLKHYFRQLGKVFQETLEKNRDCTFFMNSSVTKIVRLDSEKYLVYMSNQDQPLITNNLVLALGGKHKQIEPGFTINNLLISDYNQKLLDSDLVLQNEFTEAKLKKLNRKSKIVILGGSHSAFSCAHRLIVQFGENFFENENIEIWCRKAPKIFYNSREEALLSGYSDFSESDICPVTKRVYRLAGLRMDGRSLYLKMIGLDKLSAIKSVKLKLLSEFGNELEKSLKEADLIISALGYTMNMIPGFSQNGERLNFYGRSTGIWVNEKCQVLDENGEIFPNLYATGMATGFIPSGELGGESTFTGQTNGVWYYQNVIAEMILSDLFDTYNETKKHA